MAQYAPDFLASLKHRYEKTDQPMIELAREFGIGITTLQVLVDKQSWEKRSQRLRGLPSAMRLEPEAEALAAAAVSSPPPERRSSIAEQSDGNQVEVMETAQIESQQETPTPTLPPSGGGSAPAAPSPIERLEALVVQEIADLESARDLRRGKRVSGAGTERTAQALASLTRTLQTIRRMRGDQPADQPGYDEFDGLDIDQQRELLAHRIDALVDEWLAEEARDPAAAAANAEPKPMEP
jgi:hypothetical protein